MAELQGNITILMFKDNTWNMKSAFTNLSTIKILTQVIEKLAQDLEEAMMTDPVPDMKPVEPIIPILPDKYRTQ